MIRFRRLSVAIHWGLPIDRRRPLSLENSLEMKTPPEWAAFLVFDA